MSRCFPKSQDCACRHSQDYGEEDTAESRPTEQKYLASVENKATRRRTGESVSVDYDQILDRGVLTDNVGGAADQRLRNTYSHRSQSVELASDSIDGAMRDDESRHNDHGRGANGELA